MAGINYTASHARSSPNSSAKITQDEERGPPEIPSIPIDLLDHKLVLTFHWTVLFTCSCALPIAMYFILKYVAHGKESLVIGVSSAIFGAISLPSLSFRTWSLVRAKSVSRPLGGSRWAMDYFNYNFIFGFIYITVLIIVSTILKPAKPRIACLPLSLLLVQVCTQLLATTVMVPLRARYPFRFSSMPKGEPSRPALYTIIEDVVAVDGRQGAKFREVWNRRYLTSAPIKQLLREMDLLWGISGIVVAAALVVIIFKIHNVDISWILGWSVPWVWAAMCTLITMARTKAALTKERSLMRHGQTSPESKSFPR